MGEPLKMPAVQQSDNRYHPCWSSVSVAQGQMPEASTPGSCVATHLGHPMPDRPGQPMPGRVRVACPATASMIGFEPFGFTLP